MASLARIAFVTAVIAIIGAALVTGWADLTDQASLHAYAGHLDRLRSTFGLSWKQAVDWDLQAHACELEGPADHQRYVLECHFYGLGVGLEASETLARSYFLEAA